jgi:DNA-binding transcriptional LysR family regulator
MLALAEEAEQRLHEDQAALRGHLRLFATIDFGQSVVTRLIANFLQTNPGVTAELGYTNRPVHVIQEGYDAGVVAGDITDDTVVARPSGKIMRYLVASSAFLKSRSPPKRCLTSNHGHGSVCPHDLESVKMSRYILLKEVSKRFGFHPC